MVVIQNKHNRNVNHLTLSPNNMKKPISICNDLLSLNDSIYYAAVVNMFGEIIYHKVTGTFQLPKNPLFTNSIIS